MTDKIITRYIYPPIPIRTMDFCTFYDGDEESGPRGWGRTEAEAIADLQDNYDTPQEREENRAAAARRLARQIEDEERHGPDDFAIGKDGWHE